MDCAFDVHRRLGPGFREKIYHEALCLELDVSGLRFEREKAIEVAYRDWRIPGQRLDLLVEAKVVVEVKAVPRLRSLHHSQVFSYLRTMELRIGLLLNFNCRLLKEGCKRVIR